MCSSDLAAASAICLDVRSLDEPGLAQLIEMAAQGGRCDADAAGQLVTAHRPLRQGLKDLHAGRVRQQGSDNTRLTHESECYSRMRD